MKKHERASSHLFALALLMLATLAMSPSEAHARGRIEINEDARIDIGLMGQFLVLITQRDTNQDGALDTDKQFRMRRARLVVDGEFLGWIHLFLQSEINDTLEVELIDAFIHLKPIDEIQVIVGPHLVPVSRQNITAVAATMTFDRLPLNHRSLAWGDRASQRLGNGAYPGTDSGFRTDIAVRDIGATFLGHTSFTDTAHLKYHVGVYEGIHTADSQTPHLAGRVQLNLFDAEPGFIQRGTYLGKKRMIAIGGGGEYQGDLVRSEFGQIVDFTSWTADLFIDWPVGPGAVTFESAYVGTRFLGAQNADDGDPATPGRDLRPSAGDGFHGTIGYYISQWQPWFAYSQWLAQTDSGSFTTVQGGLTYFLMGHNVNFRVAYEFFSPVIGDDIHSGVGAVYLLY